MDTCWLTPSGSFGVFELIERFGFHGDAVTGLGGWHVAAVTHVDGIYEVLVEVIDVFDEAAFQRCRDRDVSSHRADSRAGLLDLRIDGSRRIPLTALEEYVSRLLAERTAA